MQNMATPPKTVRRPNTTQPLVKGSTTPKEIDLDLLRNDLETSDSSEDESNLNGIDQEPSTSKSQQMNNTSKDNLKRKIVFINDHTGPRKFSTKQAARKRHSKPSTPFRAANQVKSTTKQIRSPSLDICLRDLLGDLLNIQSNKIQLKDHECSKLSYEMQKMHKYFQDQMEYFKANKSNN